MYNVRLKKLGNNAHELTIHDTVILFSYNMPVASNEDGQFFVTDETHSVTTAKHIKVWLGRAKAIEMPQEHFDLMRRI